MDLSARLDAARDALGELERELARHHGVCRIEVDLVVGAGVIEVAGHVLVDRLRAQVLSAVAAHLPPGWVVRDAMDVVQGGPWYALPGRLRLRASRGRDAALVTVLLRDDGPVELLGRAHGATLIRDRWGTAAWTNGALGPPSEAPRLPSPCSRAPGDLVEAALRFIDVPYDLGGTDRVGLDCSGLVQRSAWWGLRVAVPRNTGDLRSLGAFAGLPPPGPGHLSFVWTQDESVGHVGITSADAVVHASRSRGRVVADPQARFYAAASRIEHLPFEALLDHADRCAGAPNLLAAGLRLARG